VSEHPRAVAFNLSSEASRAEDRRAIYQQDMESVRYRHGAKWSRFQTVSALEGAALYVSFRGGMSRTESVLLMVLVTLLLAVVVALVVTDERSMSAYCKRVREFEDATGASPLNGIYYPVVWFNPTYTLIAAVLVFNAAVIVRLAFWPSGL
jgi:hypothetical protein